jgi:hypothetical protein
MVRLPVYFLIDIYTKSCVRNLILIRIGNYSAYTHFIYESEIDSNTRRWTADNQQSGHSLQLATNLVLLI